MGGGTGNKAIMLKEMPVLCAVWWYNHSNNFALSKQSAEMRRLRTAPRCRFTHGINWTSGFDWLCANLQHMLKLIPEMCSVTSEQREMKPGE